MRKEERELNNQGLTRSFYISRHDMDFYLALTSMLRARDMSVSEFAIFCFKYVVLEEGSEIFTDFKEHYQKVIEERLGEMVVKYKGKKMKLDELVESELIKESGFVKI